MLELSAGVVYARESRPSRWSIVSFCLDRLLLEAR
jgi:hypothetical protein